MDNSYYDNDGGILYVFRYTDDTPFMTVLQSTTKSKPKRFFMPELPLRKCRADAQNDLDRFASKHNLEIVD